MGIYPGLRTDLKSPMPNNASTQRLSGGRMPTRIFFASYFFGPILKDEFSRYRYSLARAAGSEGSEAAGAGDQAVESARLSYPRMSELLALRLPPALTIAASKSSRKSDGTFEITFDRKTFSRMNHDMVEKPTPSGLRLRQAIEHENHQLLWKTLFADNFGAGYQVLPTYRQLTANMATVAAGIELMLYQAWGGEVMPLLAKAPQIFRDLDLDAINRIALHTGVSVGVALAAIIQLGGRPGSPAVRAALEKGNWEPLHEAIWGPMMPGFRSHPFFQQFLGQLQNPTAKGLPGRPPALVAPERVVRAPKEQPVTPKVAQETPAAPIVVPESPAAVTAALVDTAPTTTPPLNKPRLFGKTDKL